MSSSVDRRLSRLLGRVAEERAARGRPTHSHVAPRARTFTSGVFQEPTVSGSEAVIANFSYTPGLELEGQNFTRQAGYDAGANPIRVQDTTRVIISCVGVDYEGLSSHPGTAMSPRRGNANKPSKDEISLIDRLFPNW